MPRAELKLVPGVDLIKTLNLNESAISDTNQVRFLPDRNQLGLVQKMGGWQSYYSSAISSTVRAMKAYNDLNNLNHLALGCAGPAPGSNAYGSLQVLTSGTLTDITPQFRSNYVANATSTLNGISYVIQNTGTTDFTSIGSSSNDLYTYFTATGAGTGTGTAIPAIKISTTAGSNVITIVDTEIPAVVGDFIEFKEPVSLGGNVLQGPYAVTSASATTYTIQAANTSTLPETNFLSTNASAVFTGSIAGAVLTVTAVTTGTLSAGQLLSRTSISANTLIVSQLTGTSAVTTKTFSSGGAAGTNTVTLNAITSVAVGQLVSGTGIPNGTFVGSISSNTITLITVTGVASNFTVQAAGTYSFYAAGGLGTYSVSVAQSVSSATTAGTLESYRTYVVQTPGTTSWTSNGAASNLAGTVFLSTIAVATAGSFIVGNTYEILSAGTTSFTSIGASANTVGTVFVATGVGSGTGTATTYTGTGTARLLGVPAYYIAPGSQTVTVYLDNHTYNVGSDYYIAEPVTVNNVTLYGSFTVTAIGSGPTASTFTIQAPNVIATATTAGLLVIGQQYEIQTIGTTDFTLIGAASNTVGVVFAATGVGSGTGTAYIPNPVPANSGMPNTNFYISPIPTAQVGGYGFGGYGIGGYGTGTSSLTYAGSFLVGTQYQIVSIGSTDFTLIGATSNTVGLIFTATGPGTGTGTATSYNAGYQINATDWSLDNFGQILVACPAGGPVYTYQFNTASANANLSGVQAPLLNDGAFVAMPQRQIVAWGSSFGLEQDPLLLRWSDAEDSTTWIGTALNQAGSFRIPTGNKIVTCIQGPQQALIWTDIDCWAMQYVGAPLVYGFNKIGSNCGAISRKSVGPYLNNIYWMSQKQFFVNRGNGPEVLPCPVWDFVYQTLNTGGGVNVSPASLIPGKTYVITSLGTTDFTTVGAPVNVVGTTFVASATGSGSGTAYLPPYTNNIRCAVNSQFNEIIWYFPSTAYPSYTAYAGSLVIGQTYTIGYVGNTDFTALGASTNTVGVTFIATGTGSYSSGAGWATLTSSIGENNAYVKYNVAVNQWNFGYNLTGTAFDGSTQVSQFVGRTAWIDQSVLGNPIGTGYDNFIYQHEVGYNAYKGNVSYPMTSSFSTGFFQIAEADQLVFVDQIWPDFVWGEYSGDPTTSPNGGNNYTATIQMYILYTNDVDEAESYDGANGINTLGPFTFSYGMQPSYVSCRIRARFIRLLFFSNDSNTWWRLGGLRYRYQPDGRY